MRLAFGGGIVFAAWCLGFAWSPDSAQRVYFEVAAQLIPVLVLALAVESRLLRLGELWRQRRRVGRAGWWSRALDSFGGLVDMLPAPLMLAALGVAQWQCLCNLASMSESGRADPAWVSAGVLAGLVGVGVIALFGAGGACEASDEGKPMGDQDRAGPVRPGNAPRSWSRPVGQLAAAYVISSALRRPRRGAARRGADHTQ